MAEERNMTDQIETNASELDAEDLERVAGGITDGTSNTLMARKAGGEQQDYGAGGQTNVLVALLVP
jgi:hypothetical protein